MKWVFFATVVLNVALGVFLYLHNTRPNPDARLPALQMNAEQIRIVDPRELPARPQASACLEWRSFGVAELKRAQDLLEPLALGERVQTREVTVTTNWWAYMPPQGSQRLMERKARELRDIGITDFFPITQPGQWRYAITLGSFATEQGARAFLARPGRAHRRSRRTRTTPHPHRTPHPRSHRPAIGADPRTRGAIPGNRTPCNGVPFVRGGDVPAVNRPRKGGNPMRMRGGRVQACRYCRRVPDGTATSAKRESSCEGIPGNRYLQ
jgi:hypothetical protein